MCSVNRLRLPLQVHVVTVIFSVGAYVWLLVILLLNTPDMIDVWEALLTFLAFPVLVLLAFYADKWKDDGSFLHPTSALCMVHAARLRTVCLCSIRSFISFRPTALSPTTPPVSIPPHLIPHRTRPGHALRQLYPTHPQPQPHPGQAGGGSTHS